jgi:EmrB/QacA subfamily drug resistance transporter
MAAKTPRNPILVAMIVACAMFMEQFDGTVISTALPAMAQTFGANPIRLNLAITAYMLSLAIFIPISGWVADKYGAKQVFRGAILVFMAGSLLCGISVSLQMLTLARIIQGIGGAMMVPVGRLVLLRSVDKSALVRAMAYLTVPAQLGPILGPPIGGFVTTYLSWRWIFFLNLPIGIVGIVLVSMFIENMREAEVFPLDLGGFALSGIALSCLIYSLDIVGRTPDSLFGWELFCGGFFLVAATIYHSLHHPHPLVDLSLCAVPSFGISLLGGSLFRLGVGALPFLLPLMLQIGFGLSAVASGLITFASAGGSMAMKMSAGPILKRYGFRTVLVGNAVISGVSLLACALFTKSTPAWVIFVVLLAGGFFRSLQFTGLNVMAYADIPTARMSAASSFYSMAQQVSIGAGVAIGALLLHIALGFHGGATRLPSTADFHFAFLVIGVLSTLSVFQFMGLSADAGAEVSGFRPAVTRKSP